MNTIPSAAFFDDSLLHEVRSRFCHVDHCPLAERPRIYFENAGGALTLESVVASTARYSAIPDNQGRPNPASRRLDELIECGKADFRLLIGASDGEVFMGESGTELLFRLVRNAQFLQAETAGPGNVVASSLEHPATRSAMQYWAPRSGHVYREVAHDPETCLVDAEAYAGAVDAETRVVSIIAANPVAGTHPDISAIVARVRERAPDCLIILDGIQAVAHGPVAVDQLDIDGFAISGYKVFSRHNYGIAWVSERVAGAEHEKLQGAPARKWTLGTRDASAWIATSDVVNYFEWLGLRLAPDASGRRERIEHAAGAIAAHEAALLQRLLEGTPDIRGLAAFNRVRLIGGTQNRSRADVVSFVVEGIAPIELVEALEARGVRTHVRKADVFSGAVLEPLELDSCVRLSLAHYNSAAEVDQCLMILAELISAPEGG